MATKINKILVTGSKGFIGTHLMKALGETGVGFDIALNPNMDINRAKAFEAIVKKVKPQAIVHLAAISSRTECDNDPELALKTNIVGTFNVLRIAHKYKIKTIIASSAATKEPEISLYGTSKDCMESIAYMFPNVIIARFYNVYGKGSKSVINKFIRKIKEDKSIILYGNTVRDYIYIDDIINAILSLIATQKPSKAYDIGTRESTTLKKLVKLIEQATIKKAHIINKSPIKEIQRSECLASPIWYKVTLEQGIRRLL